uniref:AFG1-like ATPase n=1 Tax=Cannabis sativa TaxID=3483 RepID=A0A803PDR0_CANSA
MRRVFSISGFRSLGLVRSPKSHYSPVIALRSYCQPLHLSQSSSSGPLSQYRSLVEQGKLQHDPNQERVALELENLLGRLERYEREMEEYHEKLAKWEDSRENERRRILMEEAELKQQDSWTSVTRHQSRLFGRWMFRRKPDNVEPGVGKWVSYLNRERKLDSLVGSRPTAPPAPKGLYIWGNVGSGKTMLMDMFYNATQGIVKHRRRYHFNEAMLKINEQMHKIWKNQVEGDSLQSNVSNWIRNLPFDSKVKEWLAAEERYKQDVQMKNILPDVADKLFISQQVDLRGASILCFDEIQTVDVFAIVALSGILGRLLSTGTVLVATSNRAPKDLNQDGMQREIFLKFLKKLYGHCEIALIGSDIDYRRLIGQRSIDQAHYFWPLDSMALKNFEKMWHENTDHVGGQIGSVTIPVMFGRMLEVPESCNGVARFTFEYLCGQPVGAADYIAVAENYHTVFISNIPAMSMRIRDKARRFITLIDELYNHHCRLVCSAAASIDELFQGTEEGTLFDLESFQFETEMEGTKLRRNVLEEGNVSSGGTSTSIVSMLSGEEEMFAFRRAVSRLIEMQTPLYLEGVGSLHHYFRQQSETKSANYLQSQLSH